jgi:disulfide bond formation protein DsbB
MRDDTFVLLFALLAAALLAVVLSSCAHLAPCPQGRSAALCLTKELP